MNIEIVIGRAKIIHFENDISGAVGKYISNIRAKDKLGGVPTKVAMPPMEAL